MTDELTNLDGIGPATAETLREAGFETVEGVKVATVDELSEVHGIGEASAKSILEDNTDATRGRPSEFNDDRAREVINAAQQGLSKAGCARAAGVSHTTLQNWLDNDDLQFTDGDGVGRDFVAAFRRARNVGELELVSGGLRDEDVNSQMAKFLLSTSFDYVKTERREHSGPDGEPLDLTLSTDEKQHLEETFDDEPET